MSLYFSFFYVGCFILFLSFVFIQNKAIKIRQLKVLLFFFAVAMAVVAFHVHPKDGSPDINRHFYTYETLAGEHGEVLQKLERTKALASGLFLWNAVIFVSMLLGNKHFLPCIIVFITYYFFLLNCILGYRRYRPNGRIFCVYLLIKIGLVSWFQIGRASCRERV